MAVTAAVPGRRNDEYDVDMTNRRAFLGMMAAVIASPAIIRVAPIMKIKPSLVPRCLPDGPLFKLVEAIRPEFDADNMVRFVVYGTGQDGLPVREVLPFGKGLKSASDMIEAFSPTFEMTQAAVPISSWIPEIHQWEPRFLPERTA